MDWNRDGKVDEKDSVLYHMEINTDRSSNNNISNGIYRKTPNEQKLASATSTEAQGYLIDVLCLGYLGSLLSGTLPSNLATITLGVVCAGKLVCDFFDNL